MMNKIFLFLLLFPIYSPFAQAQNEKGESRKKMHKEIQAQKIAYITNQLDLTPEEAQKFWPIYNEMEEKKNNLRKQGRGLLKKMEHGFENLSETELEEISDGVIKQRTKEVQLEKEYHEKFKKLLPIRKVLKLYRVEKQFQGILLKQIRERGKREYQKREH